MPWDAYWDLLHETAKTLELDELVELVLDLGSLLTQVEVRELPEGTTLQDLSDDWRNW